MISAFHFSHRFQSCSSLTSPCLFARSADCSSFNPIPVHWERDCRHRSKAGGATSLGSPRRAVDGPASDSTIPMLELVRPDYSEKQVYQRGTFADLPVQILLPADADLYRLMICGPYSVPILLTFALPFAHCIRIVAISSDTSHQIVSVVRESYVVT